MLLTRERYHKRKVVGGNLLGNVFDKSKNLLSSASKIITRPFFIAKNKLLKPIVSNAISYTTNKVKDLGTKAILNRVRESVSDISTNPKVRKILTDRSRAILSNIIAGSGLKRI